MDLSATNWQQCIAELPEPLRERTRIYGRGEGSSRGEFVLCWLHNALRIDENPALDVAVHLANELGLPLLVYQGLSEKYPYASDRHHIFVIEGARDLQAQMRDAGLSFAFHLARHGDRGPHLKTLARRAAVVVSDDFPLSPTLPWTERLRSTCKAPILLVDTSCVVPMLLVGRAYDRAFAYREATEKLYAERVNRAWESWTKLPKRFEGELPFESIDLQDVDLAELIVQCEIDHGVGPVPDTRGGSRSGYARWEQFKREGLSHYPKRRNDAELNGGSRMSAYLHYGMVSTFRLAREASELRAEKFLEELLIWRELAYSFCFYREDVETLQAIPAWARRTLDDHRKDRRAALLSWESTARARTGNRLWDACQRSLIKHGELHNNVRMTWGKAILDWTDGPENALRRLIDLNHRYALDGRNPASFGGILWCLGQFDRPFHPPLPVIGTVRPRPLSEHLKRIELPKFIAHVDRPLANPNPSIAMVGAGVGGLLAARTLSDHGLKVAVYDKGRSVGGRSSSRRGEDAVRFDHGASYFTVRDRRLAKYIDSWLEDAIVAPWDARFVQFQSGEPRASRCEQKRLVGIPGMNAIAKHLAEDLVVHTGIRVERVETCRSLDSANQYFLHDSDGRKHGPFDVVLWNLPTPQLGQIAGLDANWLPRLEQVVMQPCWSVMLCLDQPWNVPWDGAYVVSNISKPCDSDMIDSDTVLSELPPNETASPIHWMSRESSKPERNRKVDSWVLQATAEYTQRTLKSEPEVVIQELVAAATQLAKFPMPKAYHAVAHRWMYAHAVKVLNEKSLWDRSTRMGACGDWCDGPRIEGALLSGLALAGRVLVDLHLRNMPPKPVTQLSLPLG